jgi:hypothetical protein
LLFFTSIYYGNLSPKLLAQKAEGIGYSTGFKALPRHGALLSSEGLGLHSGKPVTNKN